MSYQEALEAGGAEVLAFESFGSYQGAWWARVRYEGKEGWITGSFGSCSGCDSFEAEFGYGDSHYHATPEGRQYIDASDPLTPDSCADCAKLAARLADFGRRYLDEIMTQEAAEKEASLNLEWDTDADEMVRFIRANALSSPLPLQGS
jgi:hypothetical protein